MRAQLTKRIVDAAKPQDRPYELRDTTMKGLLLRVQPSGHKAWIIEWSRGRRRTLGAHSHLTLDQARAHAAQSMAEFIQTGLPSIAKSKSASCTLGTFLAEHYAPWATSELRCGQRSVQMIRTAFSTLLSKQLADIDGACVDQWWKVRLATSNTRTGNPITKATVSRHLASLRSALSKAVEWKLLERNLLLGLRNKTVESRKVIRFLNPAEESRLRSALIERDRVMVDARASGNRWRAARDQPALPHLPVNGMAIT